MGTNELVDKITKEVMARLGNVSGGSAAPSQGAANGMSTADLAGVIDHTLLKADATTCMFDQLCEEAIKYKFKSVCVNSTWVPYVAKKLRGSGVLICAVVGFPLGSMDSRTKVMETRSAISNGANELDMVIDISAMKSKNYKKVQDDIWAIRRACRGNTVLKVIIETSYLDEAEKVLACEMSVKAGADFVKTSTGTTEAGATVQDIALMRRVVGPKIGVKASGGVRTAQDAFDMLNAGATRIGCGGGVAIVTGAKSTASY